tara:strand:+ start:234 stop:560 length:327 start_codon:yes stop_codon:yes gene_type:complete
MNNFGVRGTNVAKNSTNNNNNTNQKQIHTSFGKCMNDIHTYWKELNNQIEEMKKDIDQLQKMYNIYNQFNLFSQCAEYISEYKKFIKEKIINLEQQMWELKNSHVSNQ